MLDIKYIRENPEKVRQALLKRMDTIDFTELLNWDEQRRNLITETGILQERRNKVSGEIPKMKKAGEAVTELLAEMKTVSATIKQNTDTISTLQSSIKTFLDSLPNLPAPDVVAGGKEANVVLRTFGEKPQFNFEPKNHVDLVESLGLIDYKRGVKLGGNGFWLYKGMGAQLEWGLLNYFITEHIKDGYEFIMPPHMLIPQCGYTAGQFPKFEDEVFHIRKEGDKGTDRFLLPTAETALINYHRDEILAEADLPKKYFSYTPCYRKEAGSYRTNERGMIRGHQFNKIEMVQFATPEQSDAALEELVGKAERLVQGLGLHHQVSKLAAKDVSASMGKTYDIEVWIPSMQEFKEVSSASNSYEYQARRGAIRYKRTDTNKVAFVHTLNGSGLATSRLLPAIVEQNQHADGSVTVPEPLRQWVGTDLLTP